MRELSIAEVDIVSGGTSNIAVFDEAFSGELGMEMGFEFGLLFGPISAGVGAAVGYGAGLAYGYGASHLFCNQLTALANQGG